MSLIRCKVCGHKFEYSGPNALDSAVSILSGIGQVASAFTGNIFTMAAADTVAKNSKSQLKCPRCNSTNVEAVYEDTSHFEAAPSITINANASIDALLKRAALFLEDEEWDTANVYYDQILDADPENSLAYLGKMMVMLQCHCQEELQNCEEPFHDNTNYKKALRFGNEELKNKLLGYNEQIRTRNEHNRLDAIYLSAVKIMQEASSEEEFLKAIEEFEKVSHWKNIDGQIATCRKNIDELKIQNEKKSRRNTLIAFIAIPVLCVIIVLAVVMNRVSNYNSALEYAQQGMYANAVEKFEKLGDYKDSAVHLADAKYNLALEYFADGDDENAHTLFRELGDYKDAAAYQYEYYISKEETKNLNNDDIYNKKTYTYNDDMQLIKTKCDQNGISGDYETLYSYDAEGNQIAVTESYWRYDSNGIANKKCPSTGTSIYNKKGELVKYILLYEEILSDGTRRTQMNLEEDYSYAYNDDGTVAVETYLRTETVYPSDGTVKEISKEYVTTYEYKYNDQGRVSEKTEYVGTNKHIHTYLYDENGNVSRVSTDQNGAISTRTYFEYIKKLEKQEHD